MSMKIDKRIFIKSINAILLIISLFSITACSEKEVRTGCRSMLMRISKG